MSFVVEDGTARSDSNSYCTTAFADGYHSDRGNSTWASLTTTQKETALIRATEYLEARYGTRLEGDVVDSDQALAWPRYGAFDQNGWQVDGDVVPVRFQQACAELALRVYDSAGAIVDLDPDLTRAVSSAKVGEIAVTYERSSEEEPRYPLVERLLSAFVGSDGQPRLVRG